MKKLLLLPILLFILSCSKDKIDKNQYVGTKWTATDDISEFIYGKTCTTSIEFLTENTCQQVEVRNVRSFGFSGTFIKPGTYVIKNDSVYWTVDNLKIGGIATGSTLSSTMRTMGGTKRVYFKDSTK